MASDDLLARVQTAARYGQIHLKKHARQRMSERGASAEDVRKAILTATSATEQPENGTIRINGGKDTDDDDLTVVVATDRAGLRVVTVL